MIENDTARKLTVLVCIWAALVLAPYWMPPLGGYTALGTRVLILGLAAMSVNFLLGFTGVLSFGHAAYFGLGAYGAGLSLKYLAPSTPISLLMGMLLGGLAGAILGTLIVRRRGVYFAMVTIAFGQVFYYIAFQWSSLTGGDDGLRGFSRQPLDFGFFSIDILSNANNFYFFVLVCFAIIAAVMGFILRSPFGRTMLAIRENERRARFLGIPVERHIWIAFTLSCFFMGFAGALYALLNNFARSERAAFQPVRRLRHDGGDGRYAQLLGATAGRGRLRGSAGLSFERYRQLDVVCRIVVCARGAVLSTRASRRRSAKARVMSLLRVDNVSKHFGSLIAVDNISMTVEPGELRAVIGPNGAGKTTFFNMISGFLTPSSGHIVFDGEDITSLLPARRVWRGIARTFQITEVFPELTVRENLRIAVESASGFRLRLWQSRDDDGEVKARVVDLLEMSGLTEKADRLVGELAHGDQRATEIMMALALKPRLLLLDEPTAGMGDQETYDVTQLIRRLHRDQTLTIVLIEHDMRVVFHLADRDYGVGGGQDAGRGHAAGDRRQRSGAGGLSGEGGGMSGLALEAEGLHTFTARATSCMASA